MLSRLAAIAREPRQARRARDQSVGTAMQRLCDTFLRRRAGPNKTANTDVLEIML
jgi:hypothetical protein